MNLIVLHEIAEIGDRTEESGGVGDGVDLHHYLRKRADEKRWSRKVFFSFSKLIIRVLLT